MQVASSKSKCIDVYGVNPLNLKVSILLQPQKQRSPRIATDSGTSNCVNLEQWSNAPEPISLNLVPLSKRTAESLWCWKAKAPITSMFDPIDKSVWKDSRLA
jgi:hypothetical protein